MMLYKTVMWVFLQSMKNFVNTIKSKIADTVKIPNNVKL